MNLNTAIRRERQIEGITSAKAKGVYKGRKKTIKPEKVQALRAEGLGITDIASQLKISRQSVYRALSEQPGRAISSDLLMMILDDREPGEIMGAIIGIVQRRSRGRLRVPVGPLRWN